MIGPSSAPVAVRPAETDDIAAIGRLHVDAWRAAYRGHMPQSYLDGIDPAERALLWTRALQRTDPRCAVIVADVDGVIAGFAAVAPTAASGVGELQALNVDPAWWGQGIGGRLADAAVSHLRSHGFHQAVLWVLPSNARARCLYERHGWCATETSRSIEILGVRVTEIRYRRDLA